MDHYGGISILGRLFVNWSKNIYLKYKLFIFSSLCMLVSMTMLQFLNVLTCSPLHLFSGASKWIRYCPYSLQQTITLAYLLEINTLGRDYSNLKLISSTYTRFIVENKDNNWCNKKGLFWHYILVSAKRVLCILGHRLNKVNWHGTWLLPRQVFDNKVFYNIF